MAVSTSSYIILHLIHWSINVPDVADAKSVNSRESYALFEPGPTKACLWITVIILYCTLCMGIAAWVV